MMRCDNCKGQLADYIDGMLSNQDRLDLEAHIEECPDCRQALEDLRELDARLREEVPPLWEAIEPTPQFMAQLKHMKLEPSPKPSPSIIEWFSSLWSNHRMALATGLSVCLVIVLVFTAMLTLGPSDDDDETVVSQNEGALAATPEPTATQAGRNFLSMEGSGFAADNQEDSVRSEKGSIDLEESDGAAVTTMPSTTNMPAPPATHPPMTTAPSEYAIPALPEADEGSCATGWPYDFNQQAPTILGYTSNEVEKAIEIAVENLERLEAIGDQDLDHIFISAEEDDGLACDGLTVVLVTEDSCIFTCIDVDAGEMISYTIYPREP